MAEQLDLRTSFSNLMVHLVPYCFAIQYVQDKNVVDLCCGRGYGTKLLAEAANSVIGVDYDAEAIAYAKRDKISNCSFRVSNLDLNPSPIESVDVVTCFQGLEHLDDPSKVIEAYKDKTWVFAVPAGEDLANPYHHHNISEETVRSWFPGVKIYYLNDWGTISEQSTEFTNFLGVWNA